MTEIEPYIQADHNPVNVYLGRLSPGSIPAMLQSLTVVAEILGEDSPRSIPWWEIRYQHVARVRSILGERYAPATANKILTALRGVLEECWKLKLMTAEDYHAVVNVKNFKLHAPEPTGRELTVEEVGKMLGLCLDLAVANSKHANIGLRDAVLITLLWSVGMRRAEVARIQIEDYDPETGKLHIFGKGNKARTSYIAGRARELLDFWIEVRGRSPGAILTRVLKNGKIVYTQLTPQSIYDRIQQRAAQVGITEHLSTHDFRRTAISRLLDSVDITTVAKMFGHANVNTTARYDRRGDRAKIQAAEILDIPL